MTGKQRTCYRKTKRIMIFSIFLLCCIAYGCGTAGESGLEMSNASNSSNSTTKEETPEPTATAKPTATSTPKPTPTPLPDMEKVYNEAANELVNALTKSMYTKDLMKKYDCDLKDMDISEPDGNVYTVTFNVQFMSGGRPIGGHSKYTVKIRVAVNKDITNSFYMYKVISSNVTR